MERVGIVAAARSGVELETALGVNLGVAIWAFTLAAGILASTTAFTALRLAGAAYLIYLGVRSIFRSRGEGGAAVTQPARRPAFLQGLLTNLLNPKMAVLFTSLIPQFVSLHSSWTVPLLLGALFNLAGLIWLTGFALVASAATGLLGRPRVRRWLDRITGSVLIGLGVRLAVDRA
jgi:threonine/homoserine/homoserine lactone efflux protein